MVPLGCFPWLKWVRGAVCNDGYAPKMKQAPKGRFRTRSIQASRDMDWKRYANSIGHHDSQRLIDLVNEISGKNVKLVEDSREDFVKQRENTQNHELWGKCVNP
jgi:hypothetical protein